MGRLFTKKWKFLIFFGAAFPPPAPIDVKFCTTKRTQVPVGPAKFDLNRCNESPLRGENTDFWPVSKSNTGSLPLRGILPVITVIKYKIQFQTLRNICSALKNVNEKSGNNMHDCIGLKSIDNAVDLLWM